MTQNEKKNKIFKDNFVENSVPRSIFKRQLHIGMRSGDKTFSKISG